MYFIEQETGSEKINIYLPKVTWLIKVDSVGLVSKLRLVPVLPAAYLCLSKNSTWCSLSALSLWQLTLEGGQGRLISLHAFTTLRTRREKHFPLESSAGMEVH